MYRAGQPENYHTLFSFRAALNELVAKQWAPLLNGEVKQFEVCHPNVLRIVDDQIRFPDIILEPNGKVLQKLPNFFILQPNGLIQNIYGLTLTDDSSAVAFKDTLEGIIQNLSVRPRIPQQTQQIAQTTAAQSPQQQNQNPYVYGESQSSLNSSMSSSMSFDQMSLPDIREALASAIKDGSVKRAQNLVEVLAKNQAKLAIYFLDNENADSESDSEEGGQGTTLKVNVIDQEDIHRNAAVEVLVENLKATTIEQMKLKFFNEQGFRVCAQRWIIESRLANDKDTLRFCGATDETSEIFLYITSKNNEEGVIYEEIGQPKQQQQQQPQPLSPQQQQQQQQQQQPLFHQRKPPPGQTHYQTPPNRNQKQQYNQQGNEMLFRSQDNLGRMFQSMAVSSGPANIRPNMGMNAFESIGPYGAAPLPNFQRPGTKSDDMA